MSGRIGMIVPYDEAHDQEFWRYAPDDVTIHFARTPYQAGLLGVEIATEVGDSSMLTHAARSLAAIDPRVVGFGCTSGSFVRGMTGESEVRAAIEAGGVREAVTTSGALLEALTALHVTKVALATPYTSALAEYLPAFVSEAGLTPVSLESLELGEGIEDVEGLGVLDLARSAMRPDAEALFLSCTNLSTFDAIPLLEQELGVPVLAAIQVTMWSCLTRLGVRSPVTNQRLFNN